MLVTSRTPLRVSLFGGGTDYPDWYQRRRGAVLGFTIDKYIHISVLPLQSFLEYRYRVSYSRVELVRRAEDIEHPVVRAVLQREGYNQPLDCSIQADLPANTGLGSSSAFTVGFINLISTLQGRPRTKLELARLAIEVERNDLQERVGIQDQLHATYGGLNHFEFQGDSITICTPHIRGGTLERLSDWMLLVYTGMTRFASQLLEEQLDNTVGRMVDTELEAMVQLVDEAHRLFESGAEDDELARELARLLVESWDLKKRLSSRVTNDEIDALYRLCIGAGALAGKLCGAGGGGFLLVLVPPDRREAFIDSIGPERCVPFRIEHSGSMVTQVPAYRG